MYFYIYTNVKNIRSSYGCKIEPIMDLKIQHVVIFVTILLLSACKQKPLGLSKIEGKQWPIDSTLSSVDSIESYIKPYRKRVTEVLDSTLAYTPKLISKEDGRYNTSAGNLMADIILSEANPTFKSRTGNDIDFVLLNHGGIRSIISKGNVTARTAYEVMPFENSIAVVELEGKAVLDLVEFLIKSKGPILSDHSECIDQITFSLVENKIPEDSRKASRLEPKVFRGHIRLSSFRWG